MVQDSDHPEPPRQRRLIANAAAKLIAENGLSDYEKAKRKAAHNLGFSENTWLPENAEIDEELRTHHRLFQSEEHAKTIQYLRRKALDIMGILQQFSPYLTGSVLDGSAGRYTEIDIQLFTDSAKDVEIFLLNRQMNYRHDTPRTERAEAVFVIDDKDVTTNLIVYPLKFERISFKTRDGRTRPRAREETVAALLEIEDWDSAAD